MKTLLRRIAVVGVLGLLGIFATSAWSGRTKARYAAAVVRADEACRVYRAQRGHENASVCHYDAFAPVAPVTVHLADAKLEEANAAFARGDLVAAIAALHVAVNDAQHADRFGTIMGTVRAAE